MKVFHHTFSIHHRVRRNIQNAGLALLFAAGVLCIFCGIASSAEDKIAADTQFNGNLALTTDGEYAIAEKGWEDFLRKYPENSQYAYAKHYLGICKCNTQHFEEAEKIFQEELQEAKFPFRDEIIYYLGVTFVQHAQTFPVKPTGSRQGSVNTVADRSYSISNEASELYKRAVNQFQAIRNQFPDSKFRTQAVYYEAIAYIQLGNYENAKGDLNFVITDQNFTDLNQALYTLADVYINLKNPEEKNAMITLTTLLDNKPETELRLRAERLLADVFFLMGDYTKAEKHLKGILKDDAFKKWLDPKTEVTSVLNLAFYYYRFGETCVKLKKFDRAADFFGRIAADFPNSSVLPHALYQQGLAMKNFNRQLQPGEESKAFDETKCIELWKKVLEIPSVHSDRVLYRSTTHQLALILLQMGDAQQALAVIEQIPQDLRTSTLLRDYADALEACGRRDEAIAAYRKIFEKNQSPKNLLSGADAMLQIIQIYHKEKNWPEIINVSSEVINFDNDQNPDKRAHLPEVMRMSFLEENAQAHYETGDYQTALKGWEYLLKDFEKIGDSDSWRVSIAYCLQKSGESKKGWKFVKENAPLMKNDVKLVELHHLGGICSRDYAQTKKSKNLQKKYFTDARNLLVKAKNLAKKVGYSRLDHLYYDLAMVYFLQKDYGNSRKNTEWGLKSCPDSPIADQLFFLKGRCQLEEGKLAKAAATFERAGSGPFGGSMLPEAESDGKGREDLPRTGGEISQLQFPGARRERAGDRRHGSPGL